MTDDLAERIMMTDDLVERMKKSWVTPLEAYRHGLEMGRADMRERAAQKVEEFAEGYKDSWQADVVATAIRALPLEKEDEG